MSKASEYGEFAKAWYATKPPSYSFPQGAKNGSVGTIQCGKVDDEGRLTLSGATLVPRDAIAFANWIYATFGEDDGVET